MFPDFLNNMADPRLAAVGISRRLINNGVYLQADVRDLNGVIMLYIYHVNSAEAIIAYGKGNATQNCRTEPVLLRLIRQPCRHRELCRSFR